GRSCRVDGAHDGAPPGLARSRRRNATERAAARGDPPFATPLPTLHDDAWQGSMTSGSDQPSRPDGPPVVTLPPEEVQALRDAGRAWGTTPSRAVRDDGSIDPDLAGVEERGRPGERYVRVRRREREGFEAVEPGWLQATLRASEPKTGMARTLSRVRHFLLGAPRQTRQSILERLTKVKALAVLSSDALSSVAYATEQIMLVLVVAGAAAYGYSLPIMSAILC